MSRAEQNEKLIAQQFHALQDHTLVYDPAAEDGIQIAFRAGLDMLEELTRELFFV